MGTVITYGNQVDDFLEAFSETGVIPKKDLKTWARWFCLMVNEMEAAGWTYRGTSIKYQGWSTLIVVKAAREGTPYVVFVTERDTTACMRTFFRMWDEGRVKWREDKFA